MKHILTYESFTGKEPMKKIDLKDFKKIKKGSKIMYMGGEAEVLDNNGYILTLKKDGRKITVNKSMFDHGGMLKESDNLISDPQLENAWYQVYNERFKNTHPGIFKILSKRPPISEKELNRIWEETFDKSFKDAHPKVWSYLFGGS
jgi:hypothetical protein